MKTNIFVCNSTAYPFKLNTILLLMLHQFPVSMLTSKQTVYHNNSYICICHVFSILDGFVMAEKSNTNEDAAQTALMCQFCDQQNIKWKCVDCDILLCSSCKEKIHKKLKSADKHKILSIQDIGKVMHNYNYWESCNLLCKVDETWFL